MKTTYNNNNNYVLNEDKEELGKCPICGSDMAEIHTKDGKVFYGCTRYKEGCKFSIPSEIKYFNEQIKMTSNRVSTLLHGGTIYASIHSKNGEKYKAGFKMVLKEWNGRTYPNLEKVSTNRRFTIGG